MKLFTALLFISLSVASFGRETYKTDPLSWANNYFGFRLLSEVSQKYDENVFISPWSLSQAFGTLYYGAKGKTAEQLHHVLGYDWTQYSDEEIYQHFKYFWQQWSYYDQSHYQWDFANRIAFPQYSSVLDSYKYGAKEYFNSSLWFTDFARGDEFVRDVNEWVRTHTHDHIQKFLDQPLDPYTKLAIFSAVYFKGQWQYYFQKEKTQNDYFYGYNEYNKWYVPFMHSVGYYNYTYYPEWRSKVLELPYYGGDVSLYVVLPDQKDGLKEVQKSFDPYVWDEVIGKLYLNKVDVSFPKYKFSSYYSFADIFKSWGVYDAFSGSADFSGIDGKTDLYLSQVYQKGWFEVSEEGSEAAGVSGVNFNENSGTQYFKADHPFAFFVRDNKYGFIYYAGTVTKF